MHDYSIIWKHFKKESGLGIHLKAASDFSLPYFVDGEDKERFEKKQPLELHELHLLIGLLVGYFDKPPNVDTSFAKEKTKAILLENLEKFKSKSLEDLILDFAAHLREQNGQEASLQALMTGVELLPESNHIKYDGALDLYNYLLENNIKDREAGNLKLKELLNEIDSSSLDAELKEGLEIMKKDVSKV